MITHIEYDAPGDDSLNLNGEWVEIRNDGSSTMALDGWTLKDNSASHRFRFPNGFTLAGGGLVRVYSGCGSASSSALYWCVTGSAIWNNTGDTASLLDPSGNIAASSSYGVP